MEPLHFYGSGYFRSIYLFLSTENSVLDVLGTAQLKHFIPAIFTTALIAPETFFQMCLVFSQKHNKRCFRENIYLCNGLM